MLDIRLTTDVCDWDLYIILSYQYFAFSLTFWYQRNQTINNFALLIAVKLVVIIIVFGVSKCHPCSINRSIGGYYFYTTIKMLYTDGKSW